MHVWNFDPLKNETRFVLCIPLNVIVRHRVASSELLAYSNSYRNARTRLNHSIVRNGSARARRHLQRSDDVISHAEKSPVGDGFRSERCKSQRSTTTIFYYIIFVVEIAISHKAEVKKINKGRNSPLLTC